MEILKYPDNRLTAPNAPLGKWSAEAATKVEEMFKLLAAVGGIGLAAPQVGWNVRLFILSVPQTDSDDSIRLVVFDPSIDHGGQQDWVDEGCLSFPGIYARIQRWTDVRLHGQTPDGPIDQGFGGLAAQAIQHEMDHLEALLFIDRMTAAGRRRYQSLLKDLEDRHGKD